MLRAVERAADRDESTSSRMCASTVTRLKQIGVVELRINGSVSFRFISGLQLTKNSLARTVCTTKDSLNGG